MMAVFWVVWGERNRIIFYNFKGDEIDQLWDRIHFWASLWASSSSEFKDISFQLIHLDWNAVIL